MVSSIAVKVVHSGTFRDLDDIEMYVLGLLCDSEDSEPGLPVRTDVLEGLCRDKLGSPCIDRIMQMCEAGYLGETDDHRSVGVLREGQAAFRRQESKWKERVAAGVRHYDQAAKKSVTGYDYDWDKRCVLNPQGRAALLKDWKISVPTAVEDEVATPSQESDEGTRAPSTDLSGGTGTRSPSALASAAGLPAPGKAKSLSRP